MLCANYWILFFKPRRAAIFLQFLAYHFICLFILVVILGLFSVLEFLILSWNCYPFQIKYDNPLKLSLIPLQMKDFRSTIPYIIFCFSFSIILNKGEMKIVSFMQIFTFYYWNYQSITYCTYFFLIIAHRVLISTFSWKFLKIIETISYLGS